MICIDTDILAIYHIFKQDARYPTTRAFMGRSREAMRAVAIFSLLEVCGVMATARQSEEAMGLFDEYLVSDDVKVLYPPVALISTTEFWTQQNAELLYRGSNEACDWEMQRFCGRQNPMLVTSSSLGTQNILLERPLSTFKRRTSG